MLKTPILKKKHICKLLLLPSGKLLTMERSTMLLMAKSTISMALWPFSIAFSMFTRGVSFISVRLPFDSQKKNGWDVANSISPGLPRPRATQIYPGLASRDFYNGLWG